MLSRAWICMLFLFPIFLNAKEPNEFAKTWREFNQSFSLTNYLYLQQHYEYLKEKQSDEGPFSLATQQLAMADTFFGRYEKAEERLYSAFPGFGDPEHCNFTNFTSINALDVVATQSKNYRVVLINESHTRISTRAFIYQLLSPLRAQGFTHIALEALYQDEGELKDKDLKQRGYPLDSFDYGFYLREPVMAEIIREATRLGFSLVAYDATASSKDERETSQAMKLASFLKATKDAKLLVVAGYSHVYKNGNWMAEKLAAQINSPIFSVNQTSTVTGCEHSKLTTPYVFANAQGKYWSINPEATDISIYQSTLIEQETGRPYWLTLGGVRLLVNMDTKFCQNLWPCLVTVRYKHEKDAVAANRLYLEDANANTSLHLKAGDYLVQYENPLGATVTNELTFGLPQANTH